MPTTRDSGTKAPQTEFISPTETRNCGVSFIPKLRSGQSLTGTPTVAISPSGPTISDVARNSSALDINGVSVPASKAVAFKITGCTEGEDYTITVSCADDSTPAETLEVTCDLRCRA